ncbi:MAG: hypothetical protein PHG66_05070 [Candidatus Colwellbacteria bacterium]|nr:hypothetical protein [Candidatus Colwellbacteria bacterium]
MKDLYEIKYRLESKIIEIEEEGPEYTVRGLFPVVPVDKIGYYDLMPMVEFMNRGGLNKLPSPAVNDMVKIPIKPYVALNPMIIEGAIGGGRRYATAQEIISYAIVSGVPREEDLIAMASECEGLHPIIRIGEKSRRPELMVSSRTNGEMLSLLERFIR